MADEKLPEAVEEVLEVLRGFTISGLESGDDLGYEAAVAHANGVISSARAAIHRYAREREAAALERAAQVCEAVSFAEHSCATDAEHKAQRIRAMIHKEPANG